MSADEESKELVGSTWRTRRRAARAVVLAAGFVLAAASAGAGTAGLGAGRSGAAVTIAPSTSARLVAPFLLAATRQALQVPTGAVTVSPEPGTHSADPKTQISFLGRPEASLGTISVVGSKSGPHAGELEAYSDGDGASFLPAKPFLAGETVTVHTTLPIVGSEDGTFTFSVAHVATVTGPLTVPPNRTTVAGVAHFASAPGIEPPLVTVTTRDRAGGGDFFVSPKGSVGQAGPMIVGPNGQLVWFEPMPKGDEAFDLNEQRYEGKRVLTFFEGLAVDGHGEGEDVILDSRYQPVAVVQAGNGLQADLHELQITPQDTALITAYRPMWWNLTSRGGSPQGLLLDSVVQEIDIKTGLVMMEWDSLDHVPLSDSYYPSPTKATTTYDYFHVNSIQPLAGGILLISARNTSAAYEIDPADDGAVLLTIGGKDSSLTMGSGTTFWWQHDVQLHPGGLLTIFDDGALPAREPASRALLLRLSAADKSATEVAGYTDRGVLAGALGNVQVVPGGDLVVGWGTDPYWSELSPEGTVLFAAKLPADDDSYRAYRHPWVGRPLDPPSIVLEHGTGGGLSAAMSWNGETGIASWRLLTGASAKALHVVATAASKGFETVVPVAHPGAVVEVEALAADGTVLGSSAVVNA